MPLTLVPNARREALPHRLRRTLSRFRRVTVLRESGRLISLAVLFVAAVAVLDWRYELPALVRSFALAAFLVGTALLLYRRIIVPWRMESDIQAMAFRVERVHPQLNDALISAIQFLEIPDEEQFGSREMRQEAIERVMEDTEHIDFNSAVNSRGTKRWLFAFAILLGASIWFAYHSPGATERILARQFLPFGATKWPAKTTIEIVAPKSLPFRMARGDALDLRLSVRGEIPDRAKVSIWLDGAAAVEQSYPVAKSEQTPNESIFTIRIDSNRIPRNFRFRVRAGDADTHWQSVVVSPPPMLVPRDGRPSPQFHLEYPAYTELAAIDLPDGGSVIETVTGTRVRIRAATDRPVARATLVYSPEQQRIPVSAMLASLGSRSILEEITSLELSREIWSGIPVELSDDGRHIDIDFVPSLPGPHVLRIEDETGLGANRHFDVRIQTDPSPAVDLQRPSPNKDSLALVPDAQFTLAARAHDKIFALRNVFLEYRVERSGDFRQMVFFDSESVRKIVPRMSGFIRMPLSSPPVPFPRLQTYAVSVRLSVRQFTHEDGSALKDGDVLVIRVGAVDYDNVTVNKPPGLSPEIELQIVTRTQIDAALQQQLSQKRNELLIIRDMQRDSRAKVQDALKQLQQSNRLNREDFERLTQAEMLQQQVRARIVEAEQGLLAQAARMKQTILDNHMPRSTTSQRVEALESDLQRLADEELGPIEPLLGEALKDKDHSPDSARKAPLTKAEHHQKEVEETLKSLLERLEPWSGAGAVRGEARSILSELRKQGELLNHLLQSRKTNQSGSKRDDLTPEMKNELDRASVRPERLADRVRQMVEKMERLADEKELSVKEKTRLLELKDAQSKSKEEQANEQPKGSSAERALRQQGDALRDEAQILRDSLEALTDEITALRNALKVADGPQLRKNLQDVPSQIRSNQLGSAQSSQEAAAEHLEKVAEALADHGKTETEDAAQLQKKRKNANAQLDNLLDRQELLQKKIEAAKQITDPKEREAQLQKLVPAQQQLEREARELAQQLTRLNADDAAREMRGAARQMDNDRQQLEQGRPPEEPEKALEHLDDAQERLEKELDRSQEELTREKLAKKADLIRAVRERQLSALDEEKRLHGNVIREGKWKLPVVKESLPGLVDQQSGMAKETRDLISKSFKEVPVFARMLRQAAGAMEQAQDRLEKRMDEALQQVEGTLTFSAELEEIADKSIRAKQELALKRLDQLLDALKPDKEMFEQKKSDGQPQNVDPPNGAANNALPPLAQLKALRALQTDLAERTVAFDKAHPDRTKLTPEEIADLEAIRKTQIDIAELVQELGQNQTPGEQP